MQTARFVNMPLDLARAQTRYEADYLSADECGQPESILEVHLVDFEKANEDRFGRSAYSLAIYLAGDRVARIERVGHRHRCGGEGGDEPLRVFPHRTLEAEADRVLRDLVVEAG